MFQVKRLKLKKQKKVNETRLSFPARRECGKTTSANNKDLMIIKNFGY